MATVWTGSPLRKNGETYDINKPKMITLSIISTALLFCGGLFATMNGWLLAWLMWEVFAIAVVIRMKDETADYNFLISILVVALNLWLLGKGGLFLLLM